MFILLFLINFNVNLYSGYFEEGCKFYIIKKYDTAKEQFLKEVQTRDNGNAYYFLGEIEKNESNYDKSEEYFRTAVTKRISKKYLKLAYWNLIVFQEQKGYYNEMVKLCRDLWQKTRDDGAKKKVETLINKFLWTENQEAKHIYLKGLELKNENKIEEAKKAFFEALQLDSSFLAPKFEIGILYYKENDTNYALSYLKDIIDKIPFYGEAHLLLGEIYFNKRLYFNSLTHFEKALEFGFLDRKSEYIIRLRRGSSFYNIQDYENARVDIGKALEIKKNSIESLLILSAINIKEDKYDDALLTLSKAEKIRPGNPEITFQIGSIYYKMENLKHVSFFNRLFNEVYSTKIAIPDKYHNAFVILATNHYKNAKYSRAAKIIEFLPENFRDYEINLILAKTYYYLAKYPKSIEYFEKISLSNDDKYILCKAYIKNEMEDKARDILLSLSYYENYIHKIKSEKILEKLAFEIEEEKKRIEEQRMMEKLIIKIEKTDSSIDDNEKSIKNEKKGGNEIDEKKEDAKIEIENIKDEIKTNDDNNNNEKVKTVEIEKKMMKND